MIKAKNLLVTISFISLGGFASASLANQAISNESCEALLQNVGTKTLPSTTDGMNTLQAIAQCRQQVSTLNFAKSYSDTYASLHAQSAFANDYHIAPPTQYTEQQNYATPAKRADYTAPQKAVIPAFSANSSTTEPTLQLTKEQQKKSNINWF